MATSNVTVERKAVSPHEATKILGLGIGTVYNACRTGQLPCRRVGKRVLIPLAALDQFLSGGVSIRE